MKVDKDIKDFIGSRRVEITHLGYARVWHRGKNVFVHHLAIGKPPKGLEVDHINGDKLDNRRENLRFLAHRENLMNRKPYSKSGHKHIYAEKGRKKPYKVSIRRYGVSHNYGYYATIRDAVRERDKRLIELKERGDEDIQHPHTDRKTANQKDITRN